MLKGPTMLRLMLAVVMVGFVGFSVFAGTPVASDEHTDITVIAHRALGNGDRPELTREGLERSAALAGVDWVEIDIRCTRTGVPVAVHDETLDRTTTGTNRVDSRSWGYIKRRRAVERWPWYRPKAASYDGQFKIPTLQWMINRAERANTGLWVDMKVDGECEVRVMETLQRAHNEGVRVMFGAATDEQERWAADNYRVPMFHPDIRESEVDTSREAEALVEELDAIPDIRGVSIRWSELTDELIAEAKAADLLVCAWTLRAENRFLPPEYKSGGSRRAKGDMAGWAQSLIDRGVDCIITDHPKRLPAWVKAQ